MNTANKTVLIIDDEQIVRRLLRSGLSGNGYTYLEAGNSQEALEQFKNHTVDLALLDIKMPGKSGIELLSEILASHPDTAVVMISAESNSDTVIECMKQGAYDYITKPFNPGEVEVRIKQALEKSALRIENRGYRLYLEQMVEEQSGKIRASEENFRNSLDNSPLGIRIVTENGQTVYANHTLLNIFGYSSVAEMEAIPNKERYTAESYAAHRERVEKRKRGEPIASPYEMDNVGKNGEIRRLLVSRGEVLWNGERQFQVLYQDITERVQAERALDYSYSKLRKNLDAVIQTIALTVEMRDPYTAGHQRHVASLACAIAGELDLSQEMTRGIRVAGIIHDIGKIRVPAEILSKPGRITEMEFNFIKEHPRTGYEILKGIDFPWPVAQAVLQHHERMNGSGYPEQLSGEGILLEARVLSVADVVEAMASHRPYRPALGIDKALDEISQKKGLLYDSSVVDACLRAFAGGFKFDSDQVNGELTANPIALKKEG
jgi:PAS domain S-box-containing protein/putative nucleotidyltransferase with HDIG domain